MLLAKPGRIGPLALKNRVIMAPMGTNYGTTDGYSTDRDKRYYAERAKGGAAMIITEAMNTSAKARNHNNSLCTFHDSFIPGLAAVVEAIHDNGALAVAQLNHRGHMLRRAVLGMEPVGPCDAISPATGEPVRALRADEIVEIQEEFVSSARRLWRAGYDALEIHAANGYLFQTFFSERFNKRDDQYGGSLPNRMRFLLETVARIQTAVPDWPLIVRLSATEYVDGGYTEAEIVALALALEKIGVAAIDVSGGSNESPLLSRYCIQPPSMPRRMLEPYARPLRLALSIPTIMAGRIITPDDAEAVLANDSADFISLGRALLADPHWCAKAFGDVDAPIRPCISCNVCYERLTRELDVACVQNPLAGTEFETLENLEPQLRPAARKTTSPRRVLILGAGVAGLEAARTAAALGHSIEVWEAKQAAGGQVPLSLAAPDKEDVEGVWTYRVDEVEALGVPIRTGMAASPDTIAAFAPDLVMIATGARPRPFPIPLDLAVPVVQAWDVLADPALIKDGADVTMIGGGMVGIECADALILRGCNVTIIEPTATIAANMARNNKFDTLARLEAGKTRIIMETTVAGAAGGELRLVRDGEETRHPPGDAVVIAIGPEPDRSVVATVEATGIDYVLIGDCNQPGDFLTAIRDASMAALAIDYRPAD
jgi:2,4-dienoyl-CoA reductase-like NADH-dependent reductase (Old Yellow Enzyme family)/thioredoxin reductase